MEQKEVRSSIPVRTPKLHLTVEQSLTGENVGSHQKKKPHVQGQRRSPSKTIGGAKIAFRIKPHTHQRHSEGLDKTLCTPGDPTETEPDLPLSGRVSPAEVQVSSGLLQGQGLSVQQA